MSNKNFSNNKQKMAIEVFGQNNVKNFKKTVIHILLILGAIAMTLPFIYMTSIAFKNNVFGFEYPPKIIFNNPTLQNFVKAWTSANFSTFFNNSLFVASTSMLLTLSASSMMAFAFGRLKFPGKEIYFIILLSTMMIPGMLFIIPQFVLIQKLGLYDTRLGLILIYAAGSIPFNTFLLRGFFENIPREMEDAARIDGANLWQIFYRICLPMVKPGLATVAIFSFLGGWDEFILALTFIDTPAKRTLPIAILLFQGQHSTDWSLTFAASLFAIVPVILVFMFFQKYFIKGLSSGAVKG